MKAGTVAVIGRANAGKSTLVNVLVGEKVSIVSPKPQTTRDRILGVLTTADYQIVFEDTPGLYRADNALNSLMQRTAEQTAKDVDAVLYVIDAHAGLSDEDFALLKRYGKIGAPLIVALTKTDIMQEALLIEILKELSAVNAEIVPVSARKGKNLKELLKVIVAALPEGEPIFDYPIVSDKSERFMLAEIMREKILLKFDKEIPHGVAVVINKFENQPNGTAEVSLDIICEKPNHKAILIGKQGGAIKEVSSFARAEMEKFLGRKVFLTTYVKVKEDWRNSGKLIKEYGYETENQIP